MKALVAAQWICVMILFILGILPAVALLGSACVAVAPSLTEKSGKKKKSKLSLMSKEELAKLEYEVGLTPAGRAAQHDAAIAEIDKALGNDKPKRVEKHYDQPLPPNLNYMAELDRRRVRGYY